MVTPSPGKLHVWDNYFIMAKYLYSCSTYLYGMELNQKINIRITDEQLKRLKTAVLKEKTTLSELIRNILHQYNEANRNQLK